MIEKTVFYSAFIIRKLIDCKGKVSDDVDKSRFAVKGIPPTKDIDMIHRWPDEDSHDWDREISYTKTGADICNWLIHSYIFFFCYDEAGTIESFFVSSDHDRNKLLYRVEMQDWIQWMSFGRLSNRNDD